MPIPRDTCRFAKCKRDLVNKSHCAQHRRHAAQVNRLNRQRLRREGKCFRCQRPSPGRVCTPCRQKTILRRMREGTCVYCPQPPSATNKRLCEKHRVQQVRYVIKSKKKAVKDRK